jgi:hypothetical protein
MEKPSIIGLPMNVYGSSFVSPEVVLDSSLVQKYNPVTEHVFR